MQKNGKLTLTTKKAPAELRQHAAAHEAGHAVMCCLMNVEVLSVGVGQKGKRSDYCKSATYDGSKPLTAHDALRFAMIHLAGSLAEDKLLKSYHKGGNDLDLIEIAKMFCLVEPNMPDKNLGKLIRRLLKECGRLLGKTIGKVRLVADALLEHGKLSGDMVNDIMGKHLGYSDEDRGNLNDRIDAEKLQDRGAVGKRNKQRN
jgi:hypothetical protein